MIAKLAFLGAFVAFATAAPYNNATTSTGTLPTTYPTTYPTVYPTTTPTQSCKIVTECPTHTPIYTHTRTFTGSQTQTCTLSACETYSHTHSHSHSHSHSQTYAPTQTQSYSIPKPTCHTKTICPTATTTTVMPTATPTTPGHSGHCHAHEFVVLSTPAKFKDAEAACKGAGFKLADLAYNNIGKATMAMDKCIKRDGYGWAQAWVRSYNSDSYGGCLALHITQFVPGGSPVRDHCDKHYPVICMK